MEAPDIFVPVIRTVTVTEEVGVTLKQIIVRPGTTSEPAVLAVELAPLDDETGDWMAGVLPLVDQAEGVEATAFQQLMLGATVRDDDPMVIQFGVQGMSVWDAAKVILAARQEAQNGDN